MLDIKWLQCSEEGPADDQHTTQHTLNTGSFHGLRSVFLTFFASLATFQTCLSSVDWCCVFPESLALHHSISYFILHVDLIITIID